MGGSARKIVIVGASAAGLRCAGRLARLKPDWRITVVERQDIFSYAACGMPYVLSGDIVEADALRRTGDGVLRDTEYFSDVKGVEVLTEWEAVAVDSSANLLRIRSGGEEKDLDWDELVLATGASAKRLPHQPDHPRVRSFHEFQDVESATQRAGQGRDR